MIKFIFTTIWAFIVGVLGALVFVVFLLPYLLTDSSFENFQFVKDFKEGKIVVNQKESIYIQENFAIEEAIKRVDTSVVTIQSSAFGLRSGLIVTSDGLVVTLANAIPLNGNFKVFLEGESVAFTVVKVDSKNNLALLKIDKNNLQTVGFANIDKVRLGQKVFLLASMSTAQDNWIANEGIIRKMNENSIQTSITESKVVVGGPLFNASGELVGLNFIDAEGKISAIPINKIQSLLGL
ncbi:MAG: hypothetical protein A3A98_04055 [Candidatus Staskawiczbacteria bacterium RIFCSPLOWO2_01_FULL_40_39]|uniref:Serine protease n=1 Tax=Candidatus Staskawiczbacteria bacterium RIFCSPHIGHO2_01_FULL_39_25 TaxID=1802202 RepID=A0A1G2HNL5_9BACT|nr:MAG: hypothetical protein A2730_03270 [Candidatus Staskawiczbacteria bacterium RIFCSPHIGHO2_01_FULL_39_25]OGZ73941.1 MAG: hypothetical protein A3A98_04055 [Candidatus Staskawiczbacteria bacterium RIFCSPLOWO2_01_FULL_40_39]OGZ76565.1 MAG: hypothetical protein A3I87_01740 [Candidatus Staskawiczbacteria bacterium RIFCSPLOWO2_02_FULL_39_8]